MSDSDLGVQAERLWQTDYRPRQEGAMEAPETNPSSIAMHDDPLPVVISIAIIALAILVRWYFH